MINFAKGVYYIQEFVEPIKFIEIRVFVVDDEVIAAMERKGQGWVHNEREGGVCRRIIPDNFEEISDSVNKSSWVRNWRGRHNRG